MEKRDRKLLEVLFTTRGNIKITAGILGVPEVVVRRYLRRLDFCRSENIIAAGIEKGESGR